MSTVRQAMPSTNPILDYASPRPRGKLRLPARSLIEWRIDPYDECGGGGATIVETLAGKDGAIISLLFGAFAFIVVTGVAVTQAYYARRHPDAWFIFAMPAALSLAELVVMILVIDQTWAKTTIRARREQLSFRSKSPLRRRVHAWHAREVREVRLQYTQNETGAVPLGKIELVFDEPPSLELFVDHLHSDLEPIAQAILHGLGRTETAPEPDDLSPPAPDQLRCAVPDEKTFDRLVDVHRQMRGRNSRR